MKIKGFFKDFDSGLHDCLLKNITQDIQSFVLTDVIDSLVDAYHSDSPNYIRMATLMNSIFTHHAQTFMLTRRSFNDLIKLDTNSEYDGINGVEYGVLLKLMINTSHFKCLRKPSGNRAGVYKIVHLGIVEALYSLHSKEWFELQEKKVCEYYDKKDNKIPDCKKIKPKNKTYREIMRERAIKDGMDYE
jgi:hypothetical protein